jgi:phosphoribosylaminoimidazolecarboxamide formyltransferase/IMP cyclohydrolase
MFKNILVSVSNKTGLVDFIKAVSAQGTRIVSTGGTYQHLKDAGIPVTDIQEQTDFPEVMDGRVKTLHPRVHMSILARTDNKSDLDLLTKEGLEPFDLVVVNLYPFEASLAKDLSDSEMLEKIDVGGPTMLRAAAKNYKSITVLCDPSDYAAVARGSQPPSEELRKHYAGKVFAHVARYDSLISHWFGSFWGNEISFGGTKQGDLRYGENPEQKAVWYGFSGIQETGLHGAKILQGKPLSYNNILDLESATLLARRFNGPTAVGVKHNNPCGVASAQKLVDAVQAMIHSDPVSIFGGIVALTGECDEETAQLLNSVFLECVIAPSFSPAALGIFGAKKNLRILSWQQMMTATQAFEFRSVAGGFLLQTRDNLTSDPKQWKFIGTEPDDRVLQDLMFAEKVCAALKSNSIALVKDQRTLGLGMGQVNRVDAVQQALDRMKTHFPEAREVILASDAFFPFPDSIIKASEHEVKWILHPGGSIKDQEVIEEARKRGINMVLTGVRHFRH